MAFSESGTFSFMHLSTSSIQVGFFILALTGAILVLRLVHAVMVAYNRDNDSDNYVNLRRTV